MTAFTVLLVAAFAMCASAVLTGRFRRYAIRRGLLDVPNERSSHHTPTARGGGVAIVITMLLALLALAIVHALPWRLALGMGTGGAIAAFVGYADDRDMVSLLPRLGAHFAAAAAVLVGTGTSAISATLCLPDNIALAAVPLGLLYLVWMLNLTNFMDGIDGIAGAETVAMCTGGAMVAYVSLHAVSASLAAALALGGAAAGFLFWNWPPARIFMGDAGSGFLGLMLGALTLVAAGEATSLAWSWLILGGVFVVDATTTLLFRVTRGDTFYKAHRSHAYQHAAQRWSHKRVTSAVVLINVAWLWPWAMLVARGSVAGPLALAVAYLPLAVAAISFRAGRSAISA